MSIKSKAKVRLKIIGAVLAQIALCAVMIWAFQLPAIDSILVEPLDDYIGAFVAISFLLMVAFLMVDFSARATKRIESSVTIAGLATLGIIGYWLCFASVYLIHGLQCSESGYNGKEFTTAFMFTFDLFTTGDIPSYCTTTRELNNAGIPRLQQISTWVFIVIAGAMELWINGDLVKKWWSRK